MSVEPVEFTPFPPGVADKISRLKALAAARLPRRIRRSYQVGLTEDDPVREPGTLRATMLANTPPFEPDKLLVYGGCVATSLSLNGEQIADEEGLRDCRRQLPADDNEESFAETSDTVVAYDLSCTLPPLRKSDRVALVVRYAGGEVPSRSTAVLLGEVWEWDSDVEVYEVRLDSGRTIEPGETVRIRAEVDSLARLDRFVVCVPRLQDFLLLQIRIDLKGQLVREVPVSALLSVQRLARPLLSSGTFAEVEVRNVGEMPRWFRARMVGVRHRSVEETAQPRER